MAWNALDFRKCYTWNWRESASETISGDGTSISFTLLNKDGQRVQSGRDLRLDFGGSPGPFDLGAQDFEIRGVFNITQKTTYIQVGIVGWGSLFGGVRNSEDGPYSDERHCFLGVGSDGSQNMSFRFYEWDGTVVNITVGTAFGMNLSTDYFFTVSYDKDGGAGGVPRVTITIRSGSHTGTQKDQFTVDLTEQPAIHWVWGCAPVGDMGAGSRATTHSISDVETDFDHGDSDQAALGPDHEALDDLTYIADGEASQWGTPEDNLIEMTGNIDRRYDHVAYRRFGTPDLSQPFTAWIEYQAREQDDWFYQSLMGFWSKPTGIENHKNKVWPCLAVGLSRQAVVETTRVHVCCCDGDTYSREFTDSTLEFTHNTNRWYLLKIRWAPGEGTYGRLYISFIWGHPEAKAFQEDTYDLPRSMDGVSMPYFAPYNNADDTTEAGRYEHYWMRNVYMEGITGNLLREHADTRDGKAKVLIPWYNYPEVWLSPPAYDWPVISGERDALCPITAIINPENGPGGEDSPNSDYQSAIAAFETAGVEMIGYVSTAYGDIPESVVRSQIDKWDDDFSGKIGGIFFDEVPSAEDTWERRCTRFTAASTHWIEEITQDAIFDVDETSEDVGCSAWIKPTSLPTTPGSSDVIACWWAESSGLRGWLCAIIRNAADDGYELRFACTDASNGLYATAHVDKRFPLPADFVVSEWHHVMVVCDISARTVYGWLNGASLTADDYNVGTGSGSINVNFDPTFAIGALATGQVPFDGKIACVRFYKASSLPTWGAAGEMTWGNSSHPNLAAEYLLGTDWTEEGGGPTLLPQGGTPTVNVLDETVDLRDLYYEFYDYVKQRTNVSGLVVINPGTIPEEAFLEGSDIAVMTETTEAVFGSHVAPSWAADYERSRFAALAYQGGDQQDMERALAKVYETHGYGYMYWTDDGADGNPWDEVPGWWSEEANMIRVLNGGGNPPTWYADSGRGSRMAGVMVSLAIGPTHGRKRK